MEWQPIETAPIEQRILLFCPRDPIDGDPVFVGIYDTTNVRDGNHWHNDEGYYLEHPPTHWMPLPNPPYSEEG
jgi:hypothetical protein